MRILLTDNIGCHLLYVLSCEFRFLWLNVHELTLLESLQLSASLGFLKSLLFVTTTNSLSAYLCQR